MPLSCNLVSLTLNEIHRFNGKRKFSKFHNTYYHMFLLIFLLYQNGFKRLSSSPGLFLLYMR